MKSLIRSEKFRFYLWVGLAWLSIGLLSTVNQPGEFLKIALNEIWKTIFITALNFILFEYTIPFIKPTAKRILIGLFLIWAHLMLYSFGLYAWTSLLHIYTDFQATPSIEAMAHSVTMDMVYSTGSIFFFGITRHVYNYIKLKQASQKLRIEKQEAELNYLKSQTNPHFLFNTLNNIYSLSRKKSDQAPDSVLRLTKILRYMLYEGGGEYIAIEQELKIMNDYIALEKLRYDESLGVNFNYDIEDMKQTLRPLLLMPLVENAFKHGVSETRIRPFVDIHLSIKKRQLNFAVKNSTDTLTGEKTVKENIGLANLRRQLELLYTDYNLAVQQGDSVFTAVLKINLASHV